MKPGITALLLAAIILIVPGCSSEEQDPTTVAAVGQLVLQLQPGESVDQVKDRLGQPVSEFIDANGDGALNYAGWQIGFADGHLTYRFHEVDRKPVSRGDSERLRVQILSLRRGMSEGQVVAKLGGPDVLALEYREDETPERVHRYGPWELRFKDGRLLIRTRW